MPPTITAETPYIIAEYAPGVPLSERWRHIEGKVAGAALRGISALEHTLLHHRFSQHGSIYLAHDVSNELRVLPLYSLGGPDKWPELSEQLSAKYRIGPTTNREWWRNEYAAVQANRGPWKDMAAIIKSAAEFQLNALDTAVDISSPYIKSQPSDIPLLRRLLDLCIRVAPFVVPSNPELSKPVLNHPDLTLSNLIVPEEGWAHTKYVLDWQCAAVSPFCMLCGFPPAVLYPQTVVPIPTDGSMPPWPTNFDELAPDQQDFVRVHHRLACRHRGYGILVPLGDPLRAEAWQLPHGDALANLVPYITRCIVDGPRELRGFLIEQQKMWDSFADKPCPIDFSDEEINAHASEDDMFEEYKENVGNLCDEIGCLDDFSVNIGDYEAAKAAVEAQRLGWDAAAMKGPFPIYEGAFSYFLT